ncbi:hypothetical protein S83_009566 [Arachis hypogaea]
MLSHFSLRHRLSDHLPTLISSTFFLRNTNATVKRSRRESKSHRCGSKPHHRGSKRHRHCHRSVGIVWLSAWCRHGHQLVVVTITEASSSGSGILCSPADQKHVALPQKPTHQDRPSHSIVSLGSVFTFSSSSSPFSRRFCCCRASSSCSIFLMWQ